MNNVLCSRCVSQEMTAADSLCDSCRNSILQDKLSRPPRHKWGNVGHMDKFPCDGCTRLDSGPYVTNPIGSTHCSTCRQQMALGCFTGDSQEGRPALVPWWEKLPAPGGQSAFSFVDAQDDA